ncbi:hypothetical protein MiSe_20190 [Microseira wollei NIES-4236]|uniref:Uncharacterized protein n=1 Tax=Microseira wollei NIES-4236 TaxID=2530354 RepID=A0AAV3X7G6_9CYAN|nr:hypothetical protein MiSe_20190 [Microseira wollei NIES-4236]
MNYVMRFSLIVLSKHNLPEPLVHSAKSSSYQHRFLEVTKGNPI